jgi:conjugal transfer pilus assembly protein TraW
MKTLKHLFIFFGVVLTALSAALSAPLSAEAKLIDLEPLGETYPIAEADLMEEIAARLEGIDMTALKDKYFKEAFRKAMTVDIPLPPAPKDELRRITPMHVLEHEMFTIDKLGVKHVSYPKGFAFNPLAYMKLDKEYLIINATREVELDWLSSQELPSNLMVIASEGNLIDVMDRLDRKVYALSGVLRDKFYLRCTPSYIRQVGVELVITEYYIDGVSDD